MSIDARIRQRFLELSEQAHHVIDESDTETNVDIRVFTSWGMSVLNLLKRVFGDGNLQYEHFLDVYENGRDGDVWSVQICLGIFQSAQNDFENGYMFNVRTVVKAELGDEILDQAKSLLQGNFKDIACVLAGITLELAIKDLCSRNGISANKKSKAEQLNTELRKADIYNESMKKQITAWLALRNNAAHGEWNEYNQAGVKSFIDGVERFLGEYLS